MDFWNSKDEMVNKAITGIKGVCDECLLWEIDIDEQWTLDKIQYAEKFLLDNSYKNIQFLSNAYVGKNLLAIGEWGESTLYPYRRLWKWSGENLDSRASYVRMCGSKLPFMPKYKIRSLIILF